MGDLFDPARMLSNLTTHETGTNDGMIWDGAASAVFDQLTNECSIERVYVVLSPDFEGAPWAAQKGRASLFFIGLDLERRDPAYGDGVRRGLGSTDFRGRKPPLRGSLRHLASVEQVSS